MSQKEVESKAYSPVRLGPGGPGGPPGGFRGGPGMGGGGPARTIGRPIEKPKDFWGTMKRLVAYLAPRKWRLATVFLFAVLSTTFGIFSPKIIGRATTEIFRASMARIAQQPDAAMNFPYIINILVTVAALYATSAIFNYSGQFVMAGVAQRTVYDMRRDIDDKLARLPLKYFDGRTHGEILSRVTNDIDNVSATLQQSMTQLITSIVSMCGVVIMMLTINVPLTLVVLITLPMSMFVTSLIARRSQRFFLGQQRALGELNGHVEEMYTGHKVVKAFGREPASIERFDEVSNNLYEYGWKAQFISSMIMPLMHFIQNIGFVIVAVFGGILVTRRTIQIGDVQAFINYSRQFQMPIVQTANMANIIQSTIASAERVFEVLDETEEIPDAADAVVLNAPHGNVEFEHVNFRYQPDTSLIEDMTIVAKPGQTVAIVGPTGAGKTTLVNLLMRFYEIDSGNITVDGTNIRDIKRGPLRKMFGMVLQDTWLFNGTIRANIAYGREGATEEDIVQAAKAAHADRFVRTLPQGYDTVLNEEASNISHGQMQLLTIARAILADPSILILDEATSSVDTLTERQVQRAMRNLMTGRTSFVIAHRLSTIKDADLILVMNEGSIVEQGTHEELLARGGFYAELYNSQFSGGSNFSQVANATL